MRVQLFLCEAANKRKDASDALKFYVDAKDLGSAYKLAKKKAGGILTDVTDLKVAEVKPGKDEDLPGQTKMEGTE